MGKAHGRIIWDVSFAPAGFGSRVFVTGSRDKSVKVWGGGENLDCLATVKFSEAVTACAVLQEMVLGMGIVAVGMENGRIFILGCEKAGNMGEWKVLKEVEEGMTHLGAVTGLAWRPGIEGRKKELASCGDDCSVRIYEIEIDTSEFDCDR
jgi:WD40 repeat protein